MFSFPSRIGKTSVERSVFSQSYKRRLLTNTILFKGGKNGFIQWCKLERTVCSWNAHSWALATHQSSSVAVRLRLWCCFLLSLSLFAFKRKTDNFSFYKKNTRLASSLFLSSLYKPRLFIPVISIRPDSSESYFSHKRNPLLPGLWAKQPRFGYIHARRQARIGKAGFEAGKQALLSWKSQSCLRDAANECQGSSGT